MVGVNSNGLIYSQKKKCHQNLTRGAAPRGPAGGFLGEPPQTPPAVQRRLRRRGGSGAPPPLRASWPFAICTAFGLLAFALFDFLSFSLSAFLAAALVVFIIFSAFHHMKYPALADWHTQVTNHDLLDNAVKIPASYIAS